MSDSLHVGYILKMYPRFSETFIVNEILAHEAAGLAVDIFSLRAPVDGRFHADYSWVRATVTYVDAAEPKAIAFWSEVHLVAQLYPAVWTVLQQNRAADLRDLHQALLIARGVHDRDINRLHAHFGSVATTVAQLTSAITGIPFFFTAHAKDIYHESVDDADLAGKLRGAARVITVSDFNLAHLRGQYGAAAAGVTRVYNGLDLAKFPFDPAQQRLPRIVAVGRLVEKKGFGDLVRACALLQARGVDFACDIIGDGPLAANLQAQIRDLALEPRVRLLGALPQSQVIRHVQGASLFAAPCVVGGDGNRDGLPTVLLEAMALGTACISTSVTGIPEVVRHNETGLLVAEANPDQLADACALLLDDPALRSRLTAAARRLIEAEFDITINAAAIRRLYAAAAPQTTHRMKEAA